MAGNIKGITIEFKGETSSLEQAIKKVNSSTKEIDKNLKEVNKALKFNPTNVDLWRQKQDLLKAKIAETKNNLTDLKAVQAQMDDDKVDKQSMEYQKLQREIIETESKLKTFEGQLKQVGNVNLRAASEQFKQWGSALENAGRQMQGLSMAAAGVVASLGAITYKAGANADDLNTLSKVYSINTTDLQKYAVAADLVDVSVEDIAKSHVKLEKSMYSANNGSKAQTEAFEKLGVSVTNADGSLRDSDAVWQDTIAALGTMTNETERDALAQQLMGKSAANLNPLIEDQGETYKNLSDTLAQYDLELVDQETLDGANQFNDALDTMKAMGTVALQTVGSQLASYLAPALEKVVDWVGKLAGWLSNLSPEVLTVIGVIAGVIAAIAPVLIFLGKLATGISSIMSLASTLGVSIGALAGPFGIALAVIAALIAIGVLLYKNWDKIKAKATEIKDAVVAKWNELKTNVANIFNGIKTSVLTAWNTIKQFVFSVIKNIVLTVTSRFNSLKSTITTIWNGIKTAITQPIQTAVNLIRTAINKIKSIINGAHLRLPKFKLPHFKINGGKLPWGIGGKGSPPKISVDWYADGGIFSKATLAGIGEAGPEAVVPLDKFWAKLDNIAEAAQKTNEVAGGPVTVVVQLDGREIARVTAPYMEKEINTLQNRANRKLGFTG